MGRIVGYTVATFWSSTPAGNSATSACPPAPGSLCAPVSVTPLMRRGLLKAPKTGCCTSTPSRCTGTPPTSATCSPPSGWPGCSSERGDLDGAEQILRAQADAGDWYAARELAGLLAERGDLDGLRARANAGDGDAAGALAGLLAQRGDLNGLRARTDAGDPDAAEQLAGLLARLLVKQGRDEEAERLRRFGLNPNGSIAWA